MSQPITDFRLRPNLGFIQFRHDVPPLHLGPLVRGTRRSFQTAHRVRPNFGCWRANGIGGNRYDRWRGLEGAPSPFGTTWIEPERAYNFAIYSKHATGVVLLIHESTENEPSGCCRGRTHFRAKPGVVQANQSEKGGLRFVLPQSSQLHDAGQHVGCQFASATSCGYRGLKTLPPSDLETFRITTGRVSSEIACYADMSRRVHLDAFGNTLGKLHVEVHVDRNWKNPPNR